MPQRAGCFWCRFLRCRRENGKTASKFSSRHPAVQDPAFQRCQSKCNKNPRSPIPTTDTSAACSHRHHPYPILFANFFVPQRRHHPAFLKPISLDFAPVTIREAWELFVAIHLFYMQEQFSICVCNEYPQTSLPIFSDRAEHGWKSKATESLKSLT